MKRRRAHPPEQSPWKERREKVYAAYAEAAHDPAFLAEMHDIDRAFDATIADGLDNIDSDEFAPW